jgi:GGDEF domain-containing protein
MLAEVNRVQHHDALRYEKLGRWQLQISIFAVTAIVVLAAGVSLLMYPLVFGSDPSLSTRGLRNIFGGFCALSFLLVMYVVERQMTIVSLRRQMAVDRLDGSESQKQASIDLLKTIPKRSLFRDRLTMEYRRSVTTTTPLSIIVISIQMSVNVSQLPEGIGYLGDAARAISRKLREQDSIYILRPAYFGVLLPGVNSDAAQDLVERITEGLTDGAGVGKRYLFEVNVVSYPTGASSDHELQEMVSGWISRDNSMSTMAEMLN